MTTHPAPKCLWRKRTTRALLCLLLGAATTVGAAWAVPILSGPWWDASWRVKREVSIAGGGQRWSISFYRSRCHSVVFAEFTEMYTNAPSSNVRDLPPRLATAAEATMPLLPVRRLDDTPFGRLAKPTWARLPETYDLGGHDGLCMANVRSVAIGWPCRCLMYTQPFTGVDVGDRVLTPLVPLPDSGYVRWRHHLLPADPIPSGFLLDTLFYAAPWWLILITPGALKRFRRRRRGRCIHCGYDLAGLPAEDKVTPTCPECGA